MTLYLGRTTTKNVNLPRHLHFDEQVNGEEVTITQERGEFAVERQLLGLGLWAKAPRLIRFVRKGKKRHPEPDENPYLPGYIFAEIPAAEFARAIQCRGLSPTLMAITAAEARAVMRFLDRVDAENAEAQRIIDSRDRAAMCQHKPGDALEVLAGPFRDRMVQFTRMVQAAHDLHPMVEFEAEMFGQKVKGRIDPLDVRERKYG